MLIGEFHYALRERGRKQHIEPLVRWRKAPEQVSNVLDKAQIKHSVGLIQDGYFNAVEFEHPLLEIIDYASWRADQDVDAVFNRAPLFFVISTTESETDLKSRIFAELLRVFGDLYGQLSSRREHECTWLLSPISLWLGVEQALKCGNQESCGLASSSLRLACDIMQFKGDWQGAGLNRCAILEAGVTDTRLNGVVQRQGVKSEVAQMVSCHSVGPEKSDFSLQYAS